MSRLFESKIVVLLFSSWTWCAALVYSQAVPPPHILQVNVRQTLDSLVADEDTDGDLKITILDSRVPGTGRGNKRFWIVAPDTLKFEVAGTYYLSNLLQELKLAEDSNKTTSLLRADRIFEKPASRISRQIRELYWDGLTRRIDERQLPAILHDEKSKTVDGFSYLYVPVADTIAHNYFTHVSALHADWKLKVGRIPEKVTPEYVQSLNGHHGVLTLSLARSNAGTYEGMPFVVPGGRFNEMYGWDSYFIVLGLLQDGRLNLAKAMVDNFVYEILNYGAILNANRTYYLTRSQPPFLSSMALAVYKALPRNTTSKIWLHCVLETAITEYNNVWMNSNRLTDTGLSRYFDFGTGVPPEVEPGHFDPVFASYAKKQGMEIREFEAAYRAGSINVPELDAYFVHDRSMRESGHDTSYRLEGCSADLVTVDLNSLLYKTEVDIAETIRKEFSGSLQLSNGEKEIAEKWRERAHTRRQLMNRYFWDAQQGMFFDYDFNKRERRSYVSATTLYPLWSGAASKEQAKLLVQNALPLLEKAGGIVGSTEQSRGPITSAHPLRQWDYPYGWAPHQILVWQGLKNYGYKEIAERLMYRWLYTISANAADYNGTVPEKFDVVRRSHEVFAEYGNVGTKFSYITREGFGWTNASFQIGFNSVSSTMREKLNDLIPPEWIFKR